MSMFTSDAIAATLKVYFKNIRDILSFQLLASAYSTLFAVSRDIVALNRKLNPVAWNFLGFSSLNDRQLRICKLANVDVSKFGKLYKFPKNVG